MKTEYLFADIFSGDMSEAYLEGMKTINRFLLFFLVAKSEAYLEGMKTQ